RIDLLAPIPDPREVVVAEALETVEDIGSISFCEAPDLKNRRLEVGVRVGEVQLVCGYVGGSHLASPTWIGAGRPFDRATVSDGETHGVSVQESIRPQIIVVSERRRARAFDEAVFVAGRANR